MTIYATIFLGLVCTGVIGLFLIYVGYPVLMFCLPKRTSERKDRSNPNAATLIIPAWQEGSVLKEKIENTRALNTRGIHLQVIVITDQTPPEVLPPNFLWITESERLGKAHSINRAMQLVENPIAIFSDANTRLNVEAIQHLMNAFNTDRVGAVAGEKRLNTDSDLGVRSEGIYWNYESALKKLDARLYSVVGGAGELLAIRTSCFRPLPVDTLLDDLAISWEIVKQGYRIDYAPNAVATESPSMNLREEAKRKIRIAAGGYQFLDRHSIQSMFRSSPRYAFQFLLRKWARWRLAPLFLMLALVGNVGLIFWAPALKLTELITVVQAAFYGFAGIGFFIESRGLKVGWLSAPFYFVFMHVCQIRGWFRYRFGQQSVNWERSIRGEA